MVTIRLLGVESADVPSFGPYKFFNIFFAIVDFYKGQILIGNIREFVNIKIKLIIAIELEIIVLVVPRMRRQRKTTSSQK